MLLLKGRQIGFYVIDECIGTDEIEAGGKVVLEEVVGFAVWDAVPDEYMRACDTTARLEREPVVEGLGCGEQFNRKDVLDVAKDLQQLYCADAAHANVIFFICRGRYAIDTGRMS